MHRDNTSANISSATHILSGVHRDAGIAMCNTDGVDDSRFATNIAGHKIGRSHGHTSIDNTRSPNTDTIIDKRHIVGVTIV